MQNPAPNHSRSLLPVFLTYFLDNFGLAIIYPIFTPLFLNTTHPLFHESATYAQRTLLLGLVIGAFPLAQFFGAPLIGQFSDRFGRKKAFYFTILGTAVGYSITALSLLYHLLPLLFISRFFTGLFAGNLTLCLASIADMSPDNARRSRNFGMIAAIGGLSFIIAILFGGILSDPKYSSHFNPSLPFWITASLSYINLILMILLFRETHQTRTPSGLNPLRGIQNLAMAIQNPLLRNLYLVNFFFMLSWVSTMQFFSTTLIHSFHYETKQITWCLMAIGLGWSLSNLWINRYLAKHFYPASTLVICLLVLSICQLTLSISSTAALFLALFYPAALCAALCWTNGLSLISLKATADNQGSILGINQSLTAVASMAGPAIGGIVVGFGGHLIFLFTGLCSLIAFFILLKNSSCLQR